VIEVAPRCNSADEMIVWVRIGFLLVIKSGGTSPIVEPKILSVVPLSGFVKVISVANICGFPFLSTSNAVGHIRPVVEFELISIKSRESSFSKFS